MGSKKKSNPEKYKIQKIRTKANKIKAWKDHIEKNPNDIEGNKKLEQLIRES